MIIVTAMVEFKWVGDGPGGSYMLGQQQAELAGYGATNTYGEVPSAQRAELRLTELVPGGDTPSAGNFATAFTQLATDLGTKLSATPNDYNGAASTLLSIIQGWASGNP